MVTLVVAKGLFLIFEEPRGKTTSRGLDIICLNIQEVINPDNTLFNKNMAYLPTMINVFKTTWKARFEFQTL